MATVSTKGQGTWQAFLRVWIADDTYPDGGYFKRAWRTTGIPSSEPKEQAVIVAERLQQGAEAVFPKNAGRATQQTFMAILESIWRAAGVEVAGSSRTWAQFYPEFLRSVSVAHTTMRLYSRHCVQFGEFLEKRGNPSMGQLTHREFQAFYDGLLKEGRNATTAKHYMATLRAAMERAFLTGVVPRNSAKLISTPIESGSSKAAFTAEDLGKLSALLDSGTVKHAEEWRTAVMFGRWCGMRIGDATSRRWEDFDWKAGTVTFLPQKKRRRGKKVTLPLAPALRARLETLKAAEGWVTPNLQDAYGSKVFSELVELAGIEVVKAERKGLGRPPADKTFHSLRHTLLTDLARSGVDKQLRQLIGDHESASANDRYTHAVVERLAEALEKSGRNSVI